MLKILKELNMNIMIVKLKDVYKHAVQIIVINTIKTHKIVQLNNHVLLF